MSRNVVILHTDEQQYDSLGCAGNPHARTPNIDSLARQGCFFSRHIARFSRVFVNANKESFCRDEDDAISCPAREMCTMGKLASLALVASIGTFAGCVPRRGADPALFVKPTIAVMKFENRAPFPLGWKLGDGMADILVDRLVQTSRYHVVERPELGAVLKELRLQTSGATRAEARAAVGRIKNVQYLIKGTVTDFGHVSTATGAFASSALRIFGSHNRAVMGMTFYVVDVESGEIIASESLEEDVDAGKLTVAGGYEGVSLGGSVFARTPLGRATSRVMARAVAKITAVIASQRWRPTIAAVEQDYSVTLNGGRNRRVRVGMEYEVLGPSSVVVDPRSGDVLGHQPGRGLGKVRVQEVHDRYSVAVFLDGHGDKFRVGSTCRLVGVPPEASPPPGGEGRAPRPKYRSHRRH